MSNLKDFHHEARQEFSLRCRPWPKPVNQSRREQKDLLASETNTNIGNQINRKVTGATLIELQQVALHLPRFDLSLGCPDLPAIWWVRRDCLVLSWGVHRWVNSKIKHYEPEWLVAEASSLSHLLNIYKAPSRQYEISKHTYDEKVKLTNTM